MAIDNRRYAAIIARGRAGVPSDWGVTDYHSMPTSSGVAYSGTLLRRQGGQKIKVAIFEQQGHGGVTVIHWIDRAAQAAWTTLAGSLLDGLNEKPETLIDCLLDKLGK